MKINYKKENERYTNLIKEYRKETKSIKDNEEKKAQKRQKNKKLLTETEHEFLFCTMQENNLGWMDNPIILKDKAYTFVNFNKTKIGKKAVISENDMWVLSTDFWNVNFTDCIFQNIKFVNCRFFGCKFNNCKTTEFGVVFEDCFFNHTFGENNEKYEFEVKIVSTEFVGCSITNTKFRKCRLDNTIWENCFFILTSFNQCTAKESIFMGCGFYSIVFNDSDIAGIGILKMKNADLEFYGKYQDSEFHKSAYIDLMNYKESYKKKDDEIQDKKVASELAKMYYTLLNCLKSKNSDIDYLGEYTYQYQKHHMIAKEKWYLQIWDRLSYVLCGFGEKTVRFVLWFLANIIGFAICYMFSGLQLTGRQIQYVLYGGNPVGLVQILEDFGTCVHFSVVTFSTVGYGNITPLNGISTFLCTVQILVGILFVAIFTSIMIKKLIR